VFVLMGGMGRSIDGSYAAYVRVPANHVVAIDSALPWTELAALPESYATAWVLLHDNLACRAGDTLVVRSATSALGQAAINLARGLDLRVIATTRSLDKRVVLEGSRRRGRARRAGAGAGAGLCRPRRHRPKDG
jgi:NADPH:quinone reductase-like Zn-dependent oxidoreductase